ncbi:MAG TPA: XRE family transcriptional regulator [Pirellulales bacterium]|jgi:Zn-dependent peptidase ImmA (M78 family)/DNA-binding XRE family transcriptional regulator|nr:XRE family transcriptional regulator [Pirellulales bacterium]
MQSLEEIDPRTLGLRIAEARKARGKTQEEAASHLGCSRPTYIAIEKGERPAKPEEINALAQFLGRRVHEFVRLGEPVMDLQPHLRAVAEKMSVADEPELRAGIDQLQKLAEDYRALEILTKSPLRFNYPSEVNLTPRIDVAQLAESVAIQERNRLGFGDQPVIHLRSILEWDVGLRIFYWGLPSAIAGMFAYTPDLGCCILVNRKHPPVRRRVSMLHEYGHLIVDRYKPGIDYLTYGGRKPANERFAESFALSFLMPASSVQQRFNSIVTTTADFQVSDLCRLSHFYFVSVEAMCLRLEQLGLAPRGTWQSLKESGLAPQTAATLLDLPLHPEANRPYPERYLYLAVQAFEQGEISQGQLARFLRCDPVSARELVAECLTNLHVEDDGEQRNLQFQFHRSLLAGTK